MQLKGVIDQQSSEILSLKDYEQQLSHVSNALSRMEGALRRAEEEKVKALMADIYYTLLFVIDITERLDS